MKAGQVGPETWRMEVKAADHPGLDGGSGFGSVSVHVSWLGVSEEQQRQQKVAEVFNSLPSRAQKQLVLISLFLHSFAPNCNLMCY